MKTLAAILVELNKPLVIEEITIPKLQPGQVLVEIQYSGICHTQLLEARGRRGKDDFLPHLLGHEGSGKVIDIGPEVKKVKENDLVVLSWMKGSGANVNSSVYNWQGKNVNAGAITTFSKYSIISENRLTVLNKEFSLKKAALIGCALPTGLGTVFNTARPQPGQSFAVFGCGGVGLSAMQGALIAGCAPIIAIDINDKKLEMAKQLGATYTINSKTQDPIEAIQNICPLDFAIEASGSPIAMQQALHSVKPQGGCAIVIGNAHHGKHFSVDPKQFNLGKKLLGTWGGDNNPDIHFPRYCNLIDHNCLNVDHLVTHSYTLHQINEALDDLENGKTLRPIIDMNI